MRHLSKTILLFLFVCASLVAYQSVTWNGSSYTIPSIAGEENWYGSDKVDGLLRALAVDGFQKSGGNFTLSNAVNFGANAGLLSLYFSSRSSNPSDSGVFRLSNTEGVGWRNAADSADLLLSVDSSNNLTFNGDSLLTSTDLLTVTQGAVGLTSYTVGDLLYASASDTFSKLNAGSQDLLLKSNGTIPVYGTATVTSGAVGITSYTTGDMLYASASNTVSKLGIGSANQTIISNGSAPGWGTLPIAGGGTGQTTVGAAFDALAQTTTKGDLVVRGSSAADRLAVGSDGQVLTADSTQTLGVRWATPNSANDTRILENAGLSASVGSNELTVTLKQSDGSTDPDTTNPTRIAFRSSTATSGGYNIRSVTTGTCTLTVPDTATLGSKDATAHYYNVFAIDPGTSPTELAIGMILPEEGTLISTTALSTSSDLSTTIYSTTARSSVPFRLIGRLLITETTAGTWASSPTRVDLTPFSYRPPYARAFKSATQNVNTTTATITFSSSDLTDDNFNTFDDGNDRFTIPQSGVYELFASFGTNAPGTTGQVVFARFLVGGSAYESDGGAYTVLQSVNQGQQFSTIKRLTAGDTVGLQTTTNANINLHKFTVGYRWLGF